MRNLLRTYWEPHFLRNEALVGGAVGVGLVLVEVTFGNSLVDQILPRDRSTIWTSLAAVAGSLLGFELAAAAIIVSVSDSPSMRRLRASTQYPVLWQVFVSATKWLGTVTVSALTLLVLDVGHAATRPGLYVALVCVVTATLRVARSIWALDRSLRLIAGRDMRVDSAQDG
ncbi:MAG: hypothetical protein WEE67_02570 [Chloroflexota bacterium]